MNDVYVRATRIMNNLIMTSDNINMEDCYNLCASKQLIDELRKKDHQVIWGRRGTGKTTLLKAFVYDVNNVNYDPSTAAIYAVMSEVIPTESEISDFSNDSSGLALYVFSKLIEKMCKQFESMYNSRRDAMESSTEDKFLKAFFKLQDYLTIYQSYVQGGELVIDRLKSNEMRKEVGREFGIDSNFSDGVLNPVANYIRKNTSTTNYKQSVIIQGKIKFKLETQEIRELISQMLDAFGISLMYICLDEYSEIDKVSEYSIQSKVAQLIKQVFFKSPMYSVKIATIWNWSKLHARGGNRVEGIEYLQDIFAGPDLDIMFMEDNIDIKNYFKEVLINTYLMGEEIKPDERSSLSDYFETAIFGEAGLCHLICGSQGISRAFIVLVNAYLQRFIRARKGPVKLSSVYEIIKHQYLEDVRSKIPYYTLYKTIDKFIAEKMCRYFLVTRDDYSRCKSLIKYLASRGVFMQMPGHHTPRGIRDEYKLFIIHYGNYLDALESGSYKDGRKRIDEDSKFEDGGILIPKFDQRLTTEPEWYTVHIPECAEDEVYCVDCEKIFESKEGGIRAQCPYCKKETLRFAEFINEVAL